MIASLEPIVAVPVPSSPGPSGAFQRWLTMFTHRCQWRMYGMKDEVSTYPRIKRWRE